MIRSERPIQPARGFVPNLVLRQFVVFCLLLGISMVPMASRFVIGVGRFESVLGLAWYLSGVLLFFVAAAFAGRWAGLGGLASQGLSLHRHWWRNWAIGFAVSFVVLAAVLAFSLSINAYNVVWMRRNSIVMPFIFTLVEFAFVAFAEELLFRGYLLRMLRSWISPFWAVAITSILFSAMHFTQGLTPMRFINAAIIGVAYALLTLRSGSIWVAIGAHWSHNILTALLLSSDVFLAKWAVRENLVDYQYLFGNIVLLMMVPVVARVLAPAGDNRSGRAGFPGTAREQC